MALGLYREFMGCGTLAVEGAAEEVLGRVIKTSVIYGNKFKRL